MFESPLTTRANKAPYYLAEAFLGTVAACDKRTLEGLHLLVLVKGHNCVELISEYMEKMLDVLSKLI